MEGPAQNVQPWRTGSRSRECLAAGENLAGDVVIKVLTEHYAGGKAVADATRMSNVLSGH
jgi:hypothetical protein